MCKWRGVSGEWQAVGAGRKGTRPPDNLRSWPGLDRNPPKVGGMQALRKGKQATTAEQATTDTEDSEEPRWASKEPHKPIQTQKSREVYKQ
eukprot:6492460-Amphidinium_carterae.2